MKIEFEVESCMKCPFLRTSGYGLKCESFDIGNDIYMDWCEIYDIHRSCPFRKEGDE